MTEPKAPHSARVAAASYLIDRGWGKAPQVIEDTEGLTRIIIERRIVEPHEIEGEAVEIVDVEPAQITNGKAKPDSP